MTTQAAAPSRGVGRPSRTETLASAGIVSLLGSAFAAGAAMLLTVMLGRGAGADTTGLFFQAVGLFTIATQVLKLGTNSGVIRQLSVDRAQGRRGYELRTALIAVVPVALIAIPLSVVFVLGADWIARVAAAPAEADSLARTIRILAPFTACAAILGVLQSVTRMVNSAAMFVLLQNILLPLSRLVTVLLALVAAWSVTGMLLAWVIPVPLWFLVTIGLLVKPLRRDRSVRTGPGHELRPDVVRFWQFTGPRGIGAALEVCLDWADILIVAALTSPREAGIYAVVTRVVRAGQVVDRAMRISVSPRISHHLSRGETAAARALHTRVARAMVLATWPFYLTLATMGTSVLGLFGPEFRAGAPVLALYSVVMMAAAAAGMLQSVLLMGGRSSWQVYVKALSLTICIVGNLLLVPVLGIAGAALTWAGVVVVDNAIAATLVHRGMGVGIEVRRVAPVMVLPLVVFGASGIATQSVLGSGVLTLIAHLGVVSAIYGILLWRFRQWLGIESVWRTVLVRGRR